KLTNGEWVDAHDNLILCGPTGVGKSWLACALGHKACRDNRSVLYQRVPKLFPELALARGDGRYARILRGLTGVQLLILDDWGLEPLDAGARRDLYEILEERYGRRSTVLTSQIPVDKWHTFIGDPTYADAILDRLVHNAHRIDLAGDSLRRQALQTNCKGLTTGLQLAKNDRQQGARQPGDIISYRRATSSRNQRATSSESAARGGGSRRRLGCRSCLGRESACAPRARSSLLGNARLAQALG